jgi:aerobic-type carbon monoxide dehydrogenase small subunit (CoxS/CutS family)
MAQFTIAVNGKKHAVTATPDTPLLYVLRNQLKLSGPRFGCGLGQCGACSVLSGKTEIRSCITPVAGVLDKQITTLEGLPALWAQKKGLPLTESSKRLHPVQQAWIDEQVPQCGFCQNGQIMTAKAMLDKNPHPTDEQIRQGMSGTLCRCMTYFRIQAAIKRVAGRTV